MVRRKKGKRRTRRTKTHSIGKTLGWGSYGYNVASQVKKYDNNAQRMDYIITNLTGIRYGSATHDEAPWKWDTDVFVDTWKEPIVGTLISKVLPKIPIIKTLPKSIPFVGKYLRW